MEAILPLVAMFGLMWLLLIRPQQRRMRQHQAIVSSLKAGDEVITAGGIHGTITEVEDDTVLIEVSPDVIVRVLSGAISQKLVPPEELEDDNGVDADEAEDDGTATGATGQPASPNNDGKTSNPRRVEAAGDDQP